MSHLDVELGQSSFEDLTQDARFLVGQGQVHRVSRAHSAGPTRSSRTCWVSCSQRPDRACCRKPRATSIWSRESAPRGTLGGASWLKRRYRGQTPLTASGRQRAHGLSSSVTALLLSPIANELPETVNAIIWGRQGKTQLALVNISGAMMIQATVPQRLGSAVRRLALQQRPAVVRADHHGRHRL